MARLLNTLDRFTTSGDLFEVVDESTKKIRCTACAHRCLLKDGRRGVCKVRYNDGGILRVPDGYVAALQVDPVEKKPFNHIMPGGQALSFGMLGCDLHCSFCFTGDTVVFTSQGPMCFEDVFDKASHYELRSDGTIGYPKNLQTIGQSGSWRDICAVFKHPFKGELTIIKPYYLPELKCTSNHKVYATDHINKPPIPIPAKNLSTKHFLVIPRIFETSRKHLAINTAELLGDHQTTYKVTWDLTIEQREYIIDATNAGYTSRQIGETLGKSGSYIRHVRRKLKRGCGTDTRTAGPIIENNCLRFPHERKPGIKLEIPLDENFAKLLGLYCAEGSLVSHKERPNSHTLNFSFAPDEQELATETKNLLKQIFDIQASLTLRDTTLTVSISKASVALLFKTLAGSKANGKFVPIQILNAPLNIMREFLSAYVTGDGHRYSNGKRTATTVSKDLAYGIGWLALKLGHSPSVYETNMSTTCNIQGRTVNRAPYQYTVVWYEPNCIERKLLETDDYYLIPLRSITTKNYEGDVYNMEVDIEHNYLAGFFLVKNCQNWDISQTGNDDRAGRDPMPISAAELVELGRQRGAQIIASTYNEPLITTEWAVKIFKLAKAQGMKTVYISNGNGTPEVLDYLAPHLDGYKIDLKAMRDKPYRQLGAVLQHVLDTITDVHKRGLWLEVVTLVVPGLNDSNDELWDAARFLAGLSPDIPWHVTAYHPAYKMHDPPRTPLDTLRRAAEIGSEAGLNFVYAGNMPGQTGEWEDTRCPSCGTTLIQRRGYYVIMDRLTTTGGTCPDCGTLVPGRWT